MGIEYVTAVVEDSGIQAKAYAVDVRSCAAEAENVIMETLGQGKATSFLVKVGFFTSSPRAVCALRTMVKPLQLLGDSGFADRVNISGKSSALYSNGLHVVLAINDLSRVLLLQACATNTLDGALYG
ncbi:hypothetical protein HPP92_019127 [Vanilla planifolia]|uniref:Uncharacterized protein n=1 Tax=Vanilla planifolia TaxID=51239 RepID=A0A835QGZ0_VANPL|nr:hypothetical protein HPP92_019127 [Vanilla planifolia]